MSSFAESSSIEVHSNDNPGYSSSSDTFLPEPLQEEEEQQQHPVQKDIFPEVSLQEEIPSLLEEIPSPQEYLSELSVPEEEEEPPQLPTLLDEKFSGDHDQISMHPNDDNNKDDNAHQELKSVFHSSEKVQVHKSARNDFQTSEQLEHFRRAKDRERPLYHAHSKTDVFVFAFSLVMAVCILPFALAFRLSGQFRAAILGLSQQQQQAVNANKRKASELSDLDIFQPKLISGVSASTSSLPFHSILRSEDVNALLHHLPMSHMYKDWQLCYASELHGYNLQTAYRRCESVSTWLIAVMDMKRNVMVAYSSDPLQPNNAKQFVGNGECFVASVYPKFECFHWRHGLPQEFVLATDQFLAFGGGGHSFALWMDSTFNNATSERNLVFGNPTSLGSEEHFKCSVVEIWTFVLPRIGGPSSSSRKLGDKKRDVLMV